MAHHKSAKKRIRQAAKKRLHNRYYKVTTRNAIKALKSTKDKTEAEDLLPKVVGMIDKLAKKNIIHRKNAANKKSKLTKLVNSLA
ncbi:MAG: 30S ribosomal protein S20 [Chitinophagales bacterium]